MLGTSVFAMDCLVLSLVVVFSSFCFVEQEAANKMTSRKKRGLRKGWK
jgi:hypothetical protein